MRRTPRFPLFALALAASPLSANIDLQCNELSDRLVTELAEAGLLIDSPDGADRARTVARDLCTDAENQAQNQHEIAKEKALSNWFFEARGDKPGNKRLKNLKR